MSVLEVDHLKTAKQSDGTKVCIKNLKLKVLFP